MPEFRSRKHPQFIIRQEDPFNGGPPLHLLRGEFQTSTELFYVRSHGNVPKTDASAYRLEIQGDVPTPLSLSMVEIRDDFPQVTLPATLQCAGNRRQELIDAMPIPGEVPWGAEAIGHASWTGVRLRDVLAAAGLQGEIEDRRHVDFSALDDIEKEGQRFHYGSSIPLLKALHPEVLLAYAMNGEPLEPLHGYPLRVVAPGYIGARCVKWLRRVTVQPEPSTNYFQRKSYRLFPPHVRKDTVEWEKGLMLGEMNLSSVICSPQEGQSLPPGSVKVQGYAIASGGLEVARVDLSIDAGHSWVQAELLDERAAWSWRFWQAQVELGAGQHQLVVRAVDSAANSQPKDVKEVWNFKGYMNNAWNRVNVTISG
jgi:sulfite oxidase